MRKLLMLGTSYGSCEMVKYAKSIGVYTIVTDYDKPEVSVAKLEADEYWMISTDAIDELEVKCKEENVTAVMCGISELNLERAMELCRRLGFKCYCTPEAWHYSRDKSDFKAVCRKLNAPVPTDYFLTDALTDDEISKVEFPVVVKPVDMSGNRGISYCHNKEELIEGYRLARSLSKGERIIVERMLEGEEWYGMYALAGGKSSLMALQAMYSQPGEPKNCYTITTTATNHVNQFIREVSPKIEEVLHEIGCTDGIAWVQVMHDRDGHFYIIEMGYRLDGEMTFIPMQEVNGFDSVKWLVETALGIEHTEKDLPEPQKKAFIDCACGMELWTNKGGRITQMIGFDEMAKIPGVFVETLKQIGNEAVKYRPVGEITIYAKDCEELIKVIDMVNKTVKVINENGEDVVIKYTDFDYIRKVYAQGLAETRDEV